MNFRFQSRFPLKYRRANNNSAVARVIDGSLNNLAWRIVSGALYCQFGRSVHGRRVLRGNFERKSAEIRFAGGTPEAAVKD